MSFNAVNKIFIYYIFPQTKKIILVRRLVNKYYLRQKYKINWTGCFLNTRFFIPKKRK